MSGVTTIERDTFYQMLLHCLPSGCQGGGRQNRQLALPFRALPWDAGVHAALFGQDNNNEDALENNPSYTTVYVGNLPLDVTQAELHCQFHAVGAGVIEEVRVQRDKGFGFVRYNTHEEAAIFRLVMEDLFVGRL